MASFPGRPKGKIFLDFNEARDDGVVAASAALYANLLHLAADRTMMSSQQWSVTALIC